MSHGLSDALAFSLIVALAGVLRGFSGFGFAMFAVPLATLVLPPARVVPVVLALQFASGIFTLRSDWRQVDRPSVAWLALWAVPFGVLGMWGAQYVAERPLRVCIGLVTMVAALLLWRPRRGAGSSLAWPGVAAAGAASGLLHGSVAMGGPPLTLFYLDGRIGAAAARASMTAVFSLISVLPLAVAAWSGRIGGQELALFALTLPTMLGATWIGSRLFARFPHHHRRASLPLLAAIGAIAVWGAIRG